MTSAQVAEMSVTNNSSFQNYTHLDNHTRRHNITVTVKRGIAKNKLQFVNCHFEYELYMTFVHVGSVFCAVSRSVFSLSQEQIRDLNLKFIGHLCYLPHVLLAWFTFTQEKEGGWEGDTCNKSCLFCTSAPLVCIIR